LSSYAAEIARVGVVGCGQVGAGTAEVYARAGVNVVVTEDGAARAQPGLARITDWLGRARV